MGNLERSRDIYDVAASSTEAPSPRTAGGAQVHPDGTAWEIWSEAATFMRRHLSTELRLAVLSTTLHTLSPAPFCQPLRSRLSFRLSAFLLLEKENVPQLEVAP